jgi:hypothetical protein
MERMKLPKIYPVVARDHHLKRFDADNALLILVRVANMICHKLGIGINEDPSVDILATEEATCLQLTKPVLHKVEHFLRHNQTILELTESSQDESRKASPTEET